MIRWIAAVLMFLYFIDFSAQCAEKYSQQEPVYQCGSLDEVGAYLGLDMRDSVDYTTENYIFILNFVNYHTLVVSLKQRYMFAGSNLYHAYYITCSDDMGAWFIYKVDKDDVNNPITILFYDMEAEWIDFVKKLCPGDGKISRINWLISF